MASDSVLVVETGGAAAPLKEPVSWAAVWAGAIVAVAVTIVLTLAGAGLGYSLSYSAVATRGSLTGFTPEVGAGAMVVQVLAGGIGGYLAGRLRVLWHGVHDDEAHFRDTAHGLIAWALATLIVVVLGMAVLAPYADALTAQAAAAQVAPTPEEAQRAANIAAQSSLFMAVGLLLSAFVAAVAGRIGGMRNEQMHLRALGR
jgi:hypothetical protein